MNDNESKEHFQQLENMYHGAQCNAYYSPVLKIGNGQSELSIEVKEKYFHAGNAVHGSVYFKMIDDACYFAANSLEKKVFLLTSNLNAYITRPIVSGVMRAMGKVVHRGRSQIIAEAIIYDSDGMQVARGTGLLVKSSNELNEKLGYK